jgi:putative transposase
MHLIFVTKYRRNVFSKTHRNRLRTIFEDVCVDFEATLVEFNGEDDRVHLLVYYPPKISIQKLVNRLKGVSSRRLQAEFEEIRSRYWKCVLLSLSYFAGFCGAAPRSILQSYIQHSVPPSDIWRLSISALKGEAFRRIW